MLHRKTVNDDDDYDGHHGGAAPISSTARFALLRFTCTFQSDYGKTKNEKK